MVIRERPHDYKFMSSFLNGRASRRRKDDSAKRVRGSRRLPLGALRIVAALSAVFALVFAILALRPLPEGTPTVVAKADLESGSTIARADLRSVSLPPSAIPKGASSQISRFIGQTPARPVPSGTVLTEEMVGIGSGTDSLPAGYSQIVLPVEEATSLDAGNTVEIWGLPDHCSETSCPVRRLAENAQVVDRSSGEASVVGGSPSLTITVNVPSPTVGLILQATEAGGVHFVRRE